MSAHEALYTMLAGIVREEVRAALAEMGVGSAEYTSTLLPPGTSARAFAAWCRTRVLGAVRDGRGWRCTVDAWRAARAAGPAKTAKAAAPDDLTSEDIDQLLADAGLRRTGSR